MKPAFGKFHKFHIMDASVNFCSYMTSFLFIFLAENYSAVADSIIKFSKADKLYVTHVFMH